MATVGIAENYPNDKERYVKYCEENSLASLKDNNYYRKLNSQKTEWILRSFTCCVLSNSVITISCNSFLNRVKKKRQ